MLHKFILVFFDFRLLFLAHVYLGIFTFWFLHWHNDCTALWKISWISFEKSTYSKGYYEEANWVFSHDVTKIQTKELSILLSFFFHEVLQHLKTLCLRQIFGSKGSWFCDRRRLSNQAFGWRAICWPLCPYRRVQSTLGHLGKTDTWSWSLTTLYSLYSSLCEMDITVSSLLYRHLWDRHIESQI